MFIIESVYLYGDMLFYYNINMTLAHQKVQQGNNTTYR